MWQPWLDLGKNRFPSYSEVVQKDTEKKKKRMIKRNGEVERTEAEGVQRMGLMFSSLRFCSIIYYYSTLPLEIQLGKTNQSNLLPP